MKYPLITVTLLALSLHSTQSKEYRLPKTVVPNHYDVTIKLEPDVFVTEKFKGQINITIDVTNKTREIFIHSKNLTSINLHLSSTITYNLTNTLFISDPDTEILTITSTEVLNPGRYYLYGTYDGIFGTDMYGLYKSTYKSGNVSEYLAVTQFAVTQARRVFPCFDEPSLKSTFNLSVIYPKGYNVHANTEPLAKHSISNNLEQVLFKPTPRMSTYLLAFVVSKFTCDSYTGNIVYRVCSRPGTESQRKYALEVLPKIVQALENFTGVPYNVSTIQKIDLVAIPDYAVTAMENWGLITFEEASLLYDKYQSPLSYKQKVLTLIAHEVAHMWFGNLVTTKWWSDTFLNEGLARFFEYYIANIVEPNFELDKHFVVDELDNALSQDSNPMVVPLSLNVSTPTEIWSRFDYVSYSKGGSVVRMMANDMGMDQFQKGTHQYLEKHKFNSTLAPDFWSSFEYIPNFIDVSKNWTYQGGYPVLNVASNGSTVTISQEAFDANSSTKWYIPVTFTSSSISTNLSSVWLTPQNSTLTLRNVIASKSDWVIFNKNHSGYFRVYYDELLLKRLELALKTNISNVDSFDRIQIVDDLFAFASFNNKISYSRVLDFVDFLKTDTDYFTWKTAFNGFFTLLAQSGNKVRAKLKNHILGLMNHLYESVPFVTTQEHDYIYTRKQIMAIDWACQLGHKSCISTSQQIFNSYKTTKGINKNFKKSVFCTALRHSSTIEEDWNLIWRQYQTSNVANEQQIMLSVLGCTSNKTILEKYLQLSLDENVIRKQDFLLVWLSIMKNSAANVNTSTDFFINNFDKIYDFCRSEDTVKNLIKNLISGFASETQIDKFQVFIEKKNTTTALKIFTKKELNEARESLKINKNVDEVLKQYFKNKKNSATAFNGFGLYFLTIFICLFEFV